MPKPVALLDVDGILADFTGAFLARLALETGAYLQRADVVTFNIGKSPKVAALEENLPGAVDRVYDFMRRNGAALEFDVLPGAAAAVERIRERMEIYCVTSPMPRAPTWAHDREAWLKEHFDIGRERVIHASDKTRIHGDLFLDDRHSHVHDWAAQWEEHRPRPLAILFDAPYNQDPIRECGGIARAEGWDDVHFYVDSIVAGR